MTSQYLVRPFRSSTRIISILLRRICGLLCVFPTLNTALAVLLVCFAVSASVETAQRQGTLFPVEAQTLTERRAARRASLPERVQAAAEIVNAVSPDEKCVIYCDLNDEGDALEQAIDGAVQIAGRDTPEAKEQRILDFIYGDTQRLVSKPSIIGFGLNMQVCYRVVFVGLSDSFEALYQAERRFWRYGQEHAVTIWLVTSELEGAVVRNIERKERQHHELMDGLVAHMRQAMHEELQSTTRHETTYTATQQMIVPAWLQTEEPTWTLSTRNTASSSASITATVSR